jgi:hypothetical protein
LSIYLVTYDLKNPGRNYQPVHDYLKRFTYCKGLESVWLVQTTMSAEQIRDALRTVIDLNDVVFVVPIAKEALWASWNYSCAAWLNSPLRS